MDDFSPTKHAVGSDVADLNAGLLEDHRAALTGHCYRMLGNP